MWGCVWGCAWGSLGLDFSGEGDLLLVCIGENLFFSSCWRGDLVEEDSASFNILRVPGDFFNFGWYNLTWLSAFCL